MANLAVRDIAWAAGLLEGEGCFWLKHGHAPCVSVNSTDRDVVERLMSIFEGGNLTLPSRDVRGNRKQQYRVDYAKQHIAVGVMMTILLFMSERRKAKIIECLEIWKLKPLRLYNKRT